MPMWSHVQHHWDGTYEVRWFPTHRAAQDYGWKLFCYGPDYLISRNISSTYVPPTEDTMSKDPTTIFNGVRFWHTCTDGMLKGAHGPGHFFDRDTLRCFGTKLYPNAMWHSGTGADSLWLWVQSDHHPVDGRIYRICGMRRPDRLEEYATVFYLDPLGRPTGSEHLGWPGVSPFDRWVYRSVKDATMYAERIMKNPEFGLPSMIEEADDDTEEEQ